MTRKPGLYWIYRKDHQGAWIEGAEIGEWDGDGWWLIGNDYALPERAVRPAATIGPIEPPTLHGADK